MIPARVPEVVRVEVDRLFEVLAQDGGATTKMGMEAIRDLSDHRVASLAFQRWGTERRPDGVYATMLAQQVRALDVVLDLEQAERHDEIRTLFDAVEKNSGVPDATACSTLWRLFGGVAPSVRLVFMVLGASGGRRALIGAVTRAEMREAESIRRMM